MGYIYISSPYSHEDKSIVQKRHEEVAKYTASLIMYGKENNKPFYVFSPITHDHIINTVGKLSIDDGLYVFENIDLALLEKADAMIVIQMEGWDKSWGIGEEIKFAKQHNIPVHYLTPDDIENKTEILKNLL